MNDVSDRIKDGFNFAIKLRDQGDLKGALQMLHSLDLEYPNHAPVLGLMGGIYFSLDNFERAKMILERVVVMSPHSELASLGLFHSLWKLGLRDEAFAEMKRFLAIADSDEYQELLSELLTAEE